MRFLVDMPLSPALVGWFADRGDDATHASAVGLATAPDQAIIDRARQERRVIVTADLDFPEILALSGASAPGVVLFRGGNYSEAEVKSLLEKLLSSSSPEQIESSITVVEKGRIRRSRLPLRPTD